MQFQLLCCIDSQCALLMLLPRRRCSPSFYASGAAVCVHVMAFALNASPAISASKTTARGGMACRAEPEKEEGKTSKEMLDELFCWLCTVFVFLSADLDRVRIKVTVFVAWGPK